MKKDEKMTDKITPKQQEILDKIVTIADDFDAVRSYVTMEAMLSYDLGLDSVDQVQLLMDIEREFSLSIPNDVQKSIQTIGDLVRFIEKETAQPATKVADKTVATKTQTDTKSKPDVQITITNVPNGKEKPTVLNCGTITDAQKQDFLAAISEHKPSDNDGDNHTCGFNVYYAKQSAMRVVPYEVSTNFQPTKQKIGKNELIVEMVPMSKKECGSWANYHCPICLASGDCTSPFIRKHIGALLFPDKYGKQR